MSFEDVMTAVSRWMVATEALAAVGAELTLAQAAEPAHPDVARALRAVSAAADLPSMEQLAPPQRETVAALIRMCLRQAQDLVDDPSRPPGWAFTDPAILAGWGRGSMMVPAALAAAPELGDIRSFLDVGTGVGLLAIAAARTWPMATVTGIDVWDAALRIAAANIEAAGLGDRVVIRRQDVTDVDESETYDCVWLPTFFVTETVLDAAMPCLVRSLRRGGWLVLGRMAPPPDPLADATSRLRTIRGGGADFDGKRLASALEASGCVGIRTLPRQGPAPLEYIIGQRRRD
ncbi:MAG: SAM-dependent methyltransferase [Streptosporangiaceae bacterium]